LIGSDRLTRILTDYLREQGFSEPREKANRLIQQLRDRNFILCYRGADTYGFMHRTFLEYFCAVEIVHRFEKQRTLTFEQLRDEVFGQHWQDETWHEVLRLICGAIDPKFAGELIEFFISLKADKEEAIFSNLFLAADCLEEVNSRKEIIIISEKLLDLIKEAANYHHKHLEDDGTIRESRHVRDVHKSVVQAVSRTWQHHDTTLSWLQNIAQFKEKNWGEKRILVYHAIVALSERWTHVPKNLTILQNCTRNKVLVVRRIAMRQLVSKWKNHPETIHILKERAQFDNHPIARVEALQAIVSEYEESSDLLELLHEIILHNVPIKKEFMEYLEREYNPQKTALESLLTHYPTHPKTIELLRDRALNDPDEQLREWAKEQLAKWENINGLDTIQ
jgi:hypothetical protein